MDKVNNATAKTPAPTHCNQGTLVFPELISKREVVLESHQQHITSDAGGLLLAQVDRNGQWIERFARCFTDRRKPELIEHDLVGLLRQRVLGNALGYEDLSDHDALRVDPLLASLCGRQDVEGNERREAQDQGKPLAGKSTLNRLELSAQATDGRYKKIQCDPEAVERFFIDAFVKSVPRRSQRVILDLDTTDDRIHGGQEGRHYHGHYRDYCYLPLYVFCGDFPVASRLRTSESEHQEDTVRLIKKVTGALRARFGRRLQILWRGDGGFCRRELIEACEALGVDYVFGLRRNALLERILRGAMKSARSMQQFNQSAAERVFKDFRYKPKQWPGRKRRVVGKAEWTQGGANPRFVITSLSSSQFEARELYEDVYCARGDMENRIKEQQMDLFADRTSTHFLSSNQLRLWFATLGYLLMHQLRELALAGTELSRATCGTLRLKLFKIGALVRTSCRRVLVSISASYPLRDLWYQAARRLLSPGA